ncbi:MAG: prephenate dehydrogenase/arogenate dehydrogenase family protein [Candidatus Thorarchaeota archaeon]
MRIAVIGGAGKMGKWLVDHFHQKGNSLIIADQRSLSQSDVEFTKSNTTAVSDADVVFISVPMELTAQVILDIVPQMKSNSILCEISTMKSNVIEVLQDEICEEIQPLSIHPLFGPAAGTLKKKFALIPVREADEEKRIAQSLFPETEIIVVGKDEHERIMALTLTLPYFTNMVLASVFEEEDIQLMEKLSGTTFSIQILLAGSIMSHSSEFHAQLYSENKYAGEILSIFQKELEKKLHLLAVDRREFERSYNRLQARISDKIGLEKKYEEMYRILNIMEVNS